LVVPKFKPKTQPLLVVKSWALGAYSSVAPGVLAVAPAGMWSCAQGDTEQHPSSTSAEICAQGDFPVLILMAGLI
jgi:hypothetical protein